MRSLLVFPLVLALSSHPLLAAPLGLAPTYSTYLGGSNWEHARDVYTDAARYTYVVGGTGSSDFSGASAFPGTNIYNAGQPNSAGDGAFGGADVFVTKLNPAGQVLWTKYMGGPNYDRAYAVEVDAAGNIYVAGRAGRGFPTKNGFQTTFSGTSNPSNYGGQNGFVAKLDRAGNILWSTYVGTGELVRDLAIDSAGDVYIPLTLAPQSSRAAFSTPALQAFAGKFTNSFPTTNTADVGVAKLKGNGSGVVWARWIGGAGEEPTNPSIRVNTLGEPYLLFSTKSTRSSLPTVGTGVQTENGGNSDSYLARFHATGTRLIYGTYFGGSGSEAHETHSLAINSAGHAVIAVHTSSQNLPGSNSPISGPSDIGLAQFNSKGQLVRSRVLGGSGNENPDGIYLDPAGRVYLSVETNSTDFPITPTAWDSTPNGGQEGVLAVFSPDFRTLEYSTYIGGSLYDNARSLYLDQTGAAFLVGGTLSSNFPAVRAYDSTFNGGSHPYAPGSGDAWVARFAPVP